MTPHRFRQIERLVYLALEHTGRERAELIRQVCRGDDDLRIEVESLLVSHEKEDGFLAKAPLKLAAELLKGKAEEEIGKLTNILSRRGAARGRFKLLGELGMGGMGVVFAAYDLQLGRKIAIKFVRHQTSETISASDGRAWLMREARAMAQISHPNVVAVHDVGKLGDRIFIAMEYVEGRTLTQWLTEENRPWRDVLRMFIQAGRGLAAAHAEGILHRDFKPENVLVGKDNRARVVDFGLARFAEPLKSGRREMGNGRARADTKDAPQRATPGVTVTKRGKFVGTPPYMAPEQLMGEPVDAKTDQYSFCVALFQGLYGNLPFDAENIGVLLEQIKHCSVNAVPKLSCVPSSLQRTVLRGLRPNPADRFSSMEALLDQLERQLAVPRARSLLDTSAVMMMSIIRAFFYARHAGRAGSGDTLGLVDTLVHLN